MSPHRFKSAVYGGSASAPPRRAGSHFVPVGAAQNGGNEMSGIFYIIGVIVVVLFILSFLGLR